MTTTRRALLGLGLGILLTTGFTTRTSAQDASDLAGTWTWKWKDAEGETHEHVLVIEKAGDQLAAEERFDDRKPVKVTDLKMVDKRVTFSVPRGESRASYTGTLEDRNTINGDVQVTNAAQLVEKYGWTARKKRVEDE